MKAVTTLLFAMSIVLVPVLAEAQIGNRFPSERTVIEDPETGNELIFLTISTSRDSKIYPTHPQWTSDGEWVIFRSDRVRGEAMAVNEQSGAMVQVTEGGYTGMLHIARKSMHLYLMRPASEEEGTMEIVQVDLNGVFSDSEQGSMKAPSYYQKVVGVIPARYGAHADLALDADEQTIFFRLGAEEAGRHLAPDTEIQSGWG